MPKEEKKVKKEKIQLAPNVLYPCESRFAYKTNNGSIFVISFKLKNVIPNIITYVVRLFLRISENETKFIKEFSFNSSYVKNDKIVKLIRQISNKKFRKCPDNYEEFNNEVSKEILGLASIKSKVNPPSVTLIGVSSSTGPASGLTITIDNITYTTTSTSEASVTGNTLSTPTDVVIPDTIEDSNGYSYTVTSIDSNPTSFVGTFQYSSLTSITLPYTMTSIYYGNDSYSAFTSCEKLTSVTFANGPNGEAPVITSIGDYCFNYCSALETITIPDTVTYLGQYTFGGCTNLTNAILPTNSEFTIINYGTFTYCSALETITIYNNVTSIYPAAFGFCTKLNTITIYNSVNNIASNAFGGCSALQNSSNYGTLNTDSTSNYVYSYFNPPGTNGFYVNTNIIPTPPTP